MRINYFTEVGTRLLVQLVRSGAVGPGGTLVRLDTLCEQADVNRNHALSKVWPILTVKGLVEARRGHGGGAWLARDPRELTLAEVLTALGGRFGFDRFGGCLVGGPGAGRAETCPNAPCCREVIGVARDALEGALGSVTLWDLAQGGSAAGGSAHEGSVQGEGVP